MKKIFIFASLFLSIGLASCDSSPNADNISGKWEGQNDEDGIIVFHKNGIFEILNKEGKSAFDGELKPSMTWEAITEVEPHQVYITMTAADKTERIPLGIYKIKNGKLIIREPITYHRTLGGFDMGISRYEIPKDFSGIVTVYERME